MAKICETDLRKDNFLLKKDLSLRNYPFVCCELSIKEPQLIFSSAVFRYLCPYIVLSPMKQIKRENRKLDFSPYDKSLPTFELYSIEGQSYDFTDNLSFVDNQDGVYIFLTSVPELDMEQMDVTPMCTMHYCGKTKDLRHRFDQHQHKDELKVLNPLYIAVAYCSSETEITELENISL